MNYKIIGKYIKDLIFKIPNSKTFFYLSKEISNYKINIDIKSNQLKEKIIEVEITLSLIPVKENLDKIDTRIVYTTIIEVSNNVTDKTDIEKIILIDVPSKVYSDLRKIFIFVFESSGFKDVKINDKVDFEKLYNMKRTQ
jgi:preprotein translocase subunit SecB